MLGWEAIRVLQYPCGGEIPVSPRLQSYVSCAWSGIHRCHMLPAIIPTEVKSKSSLEASAKLPPIVFCSHRGCCGTSSRASGRRTQSRRQRAPGGTWRTQPPPRYWEACWHACPAGSAPSCSARSVGWLQGPVARRGAVRVVEGLVQNGGPLL